MFIRAPLHHPQQKPPQQKPPQNQLQQIPPQSTTPAQKILMASVRTFRAEQAPCLVCPHCSQEKIRITGWPWLTCAGMHFFYECPQCLDTRVRGKDGHTVFCGFHHAYHICPVHRVAIGTPFPSVILRDNLHDTTLVCTCKTQPRSDLLLEPDLDHWDMPFF